MFDVRFRVSKIDLRNENFTFILFFIKKKYLIVFLNI